MPSFDVVSEINVHELTNAIDQCNREVNTRFDFKDAKAQFILKEEEIILQTETDFQLKQMIEIMKGKLAKRSIELSFFTFENPDIQFKTAKQAIKIKKGIDKEHAKKITQFIKEKGWKVQASIQGEQIRVTGKKRDDLQEVIAGLRAGSFGVPLQFTNFRD